MTSMVWVADGILTKAPQIDVGGFGGEPASLLRRALCQTFLVQVE